MSLEHLVVQETRKGSRERKRGGMAKGPRCPPERTLNGLILNNLSKKINNVVLN